MRFNSGQLLAHTSTANPQNAPDDACSTVASKRWRVFKRQSVVSLMIISMCVVLSACTVPKKKTSTKASPTNLAELNLQMGARYLELGMLDVAKEKLETAVAYDDNNPEIHNALAVLYQRLKRDDLARTHYQQAIEQDTENFGTLNNYGRFLCQALDYEEGLKLLKNAVDMPLNNRKWFALTNIGLCYKGQLKVREAEKSFRRALQVNPKYSPALLEMQLISFSNGKYMSARAFLERYLEVAQHTEQSLWTAIQTERALGNQAFAENYIQLLLTKFPASSSADKIRLMTHN